MLAGRTSTDTVRWFWVGDSDDVLWLNKVLSTGVGARPNREVLEGMSDGVMGAFTAVCRTSSVVIKELGCGRIGGVV